MPKETYQSKTGNAQIMKQGHTATSKFASDPNMKGKVGDSKPRDLSAK